MCAFIEPKRKAGQKKQDEAGIIPLKINLIVRAVYSAMKLTKTIYGGKMSGKADLCNPKITNGFCSGV